MSVVDVVLLLVLVGALIAGLQRGLLASLGTLIGLVARRGGGVLAGACRQRCVALAAVAPRSWCWSRSDCSCRRGIARGGGRRGAAPRGRPHAARGLRAPARRRRERRRRGARALARRRSLAATGAPVVATAIARRTVCARSSAHPAPVSTRRSPSCAAVMSTRAAAARRSARPAAAADVRPRSRSTIPSCAGRGIRRPHLGHRLRVRHQRDRDGLRHRARPLVTNAHVVAGVDQPVVELPGRAGARGPGRVLRPDRRPRRDRGRRPRARAARARADRSRGGAAAVQGYPHGGPVHDGRRRPCSRSAPCRCPTSTTIARRRARSTRSQATCGPATPADRC